MTVNEGACHDEGFQSLSVWRQKHGGVSLREAFSGSQSSENKIEHCRLSTHSGLESLVGKTKGFRRGTSEERN